MFHARFWFNLAYCGAGKNDFSAVRVAVIGSVQAESVPLTLYKMAALTTLRGGRPGRNPLRLHFYSLNLEL